MRAILLIMIGLSILHATITRDATTGIVTDSATKLMWQDDAVGTTTTWSGAIDRCEALTLGNYSNWRLPNINELASIVDRDKSNPAIVTGFTNVSSNDYWSSTTFKSITYVAWSVYFFYGGSVSNGGYKHNHSYVRCVRDGQ